MSLGPSFINLFDSPESGRSPDELLEDALGSRVDTSRPSTFWVSRVVRLGGTHTLPRSVILAFAPGARLIVAKRFTLWGILDAGLEARFELVGEGVVELLGPLEEIAADWWLPSLGRTAVELALAALWTRYLHEGVLPAPIRLDGPYTLTRTLRVLPPAELTGRVDVVLRGQHGRPSDPPTFVLGASSAGALLDSMVSIEAGVVATLENLAFDAVASEGQWALACVSLEGTFHGSRIEACSFRHGGAGIRVSPRVQYQMAAAAAAGGMPSSVRREILEDAIALTTTSANGLEVSRCLFTGVSFPSGALDSARGIDIGLGAPTSLVLRDSQFVGAFANGVAILGGTLDVTACQFANETARVFFYGSGAATADVLIRRWGDDAETYRLEFEPKGWPIEQPESQTNVINVYRNRPLTNTHATITHCVSTSPTFLVMYQAFGYKHTVLGGAVLTAIRHTPPAPRWHSVVLGPYMPPRALILQGCRFGDSVLIDVRSPAGTVVDLGTRIDHQPAYTYGTDVRWADATSAVVTLRPDPSVRG